MMYCICTTNFRIQDSFEKYHPVFPKKPNQIFLGHAVYDIQILIYNLKKKEQKEISIFPQLVPL